MLLATDPVLPKIRQMLVDPSSVTGASELPDGSRRGCLLGNTVAELLPGDEAAAQLVAGAYEALVHRAPRRPRARSPPVRSRGEVSRRGLAAGIDAAIDALRDR